MSTKEDVWRVLILILKRRIEMLGIYWIFLLFVVFLPLYEVTNIVTLSFHKCNTIDKIMKGDLNGLIDNVLPFYCLFIVQLILQYFYYQKKTTIKNKHLLTTYNTMNGQKKQNTITTENWKEKLEGLWQQFKAEGLEEFSELTEPSAMRRTLGAIAFFKVRHTITIQNGYFNLQRDLGMSVSVWNLRALIGQSKETCQSVILPVETGGNYRYCVWMDEEKKELYMESSPAEEGQEGVTTIQTRSLIDNDLMMMVSLLSCLVIVVVCCFLFIVVCCLCLCSDGGEGIHRDRSGKWFLIFNVWIQMNGHYNDCLID